MATKPDDSLPKASDFMKKPASPRRKRRTRCAQARRGGREEGIDRSYAEALGRFRRGGIRRAVKIIERAVSNGLTEVQVYRFPNQLCTDKGRAINQQEPGWESTPTGVPKEIHQLWAKYFRDRGYKGAQGRDCGFSRRRAGRRGHDLEVGLSHPHSPVSSRASDASRWRRRCGMKVAVVLGAATSLPLRPRWRSLAQGKGGAFSADAIVRRVWRPETLHRS